MLQTWIYFTYFSEEQVYTAYSYFVEVFVLRLTFTLLIWIQMLYFVI